MYIYTFANFSMFPIGIVRRVTFKVAINKTTNHVKCQSWSLFAVNKYGVFFFGRYSRNWTTMLLLVERTPTRRSRLKLKPSAKNIRENMFRQCVRINHRCDWFSPVSWPWMCTRLHVTVRHTRRELSTYLKKVRSIVVIYEAL